MLGVELARVARETRCAGQFQNSWNNVDGTHLRGDYGAGVKCVGKFHDQRHMRGRVIEKNSVSVFMDEERRSAAACAAGPSIGRKVQNWTWP